MYKNRFISLYKELNIPLIEKNGTIYRNYGSQVLPLGPIMSSYRLKKNDARELLKSLGGVFVRTTRPSTASTNKLYAVICSEFVDKADLKSKYRSEINRGLKNCEVRRISGTELTEDCYEVNVKARAGYGQEVSQSKASFKAYYEVLDRYSDLYEFWGVFNDGKLIGYSQNIVFGQTEINYTTIRFDPDYLKLYPSYALFYVMNQHYLVERGFDYVNDGFQSMVHETNVQDYLEKKFNFKKVYFETDVVFRPFVQEAVKITFPFRNLMRKNKRAQALWRLEGYTRS